MTLSKSKAVAVLGGLCLIFAPLVGCKDVVVKPDAPENIPTKLVPVFQDLNLLSEQDRKFFTGKGVYVDTFLTNNGVQWTTTYKGDWCDGVRHGEGERIASSASIRSYKTGEWKGGKFCNGKERAYYYVVPDEIYIWTYKDGKPVDVEVQAPAIEEKIELETMEVLRA